MGSRARGFQHTHSRDNTNQHARENRAAKLPLYARANRGVEKPPSPACGDIPLNNNRERTGKKERATSPYTDRRTKVATHTQKRKRSLSFLSLKDHPPALTLGGKYPIVANAKT